MEFELWIRRSLLKDIWGKRLRFGDEGEEDVDVLRICRLRGSAWIPWTMGKENFPSVRSSAKPLFLVYYQRNMRKSSGVRGKCSYFCALEVHEVVSDLEGDADEVDKRDVVTVMMWY